MKKVRVFVVCRNSEPQSAYINNRAAAIREVRTKRETTDMYYYMSEVVGYIRRQNGKSSNIPHTKR